MHPQRTLTFDAMTGKYSDDEITGMYVSQDGTIRYFKDGVIHRDNDLPALIFQHGSIMEWRQNGKLHRDGDQPAQIAADGTHRAYYKHGNCHREGDLPATISYDANVPTADLEPIQLRWFKDGLLHRENGPAIECRLVGDPSKTWSRAWAQNGVITKIECNHTGKYDRKVNGECDYCSMTFYVSKLQDR